MTVARRLAPLLLALSLIGLYLSNNQALPGGDTVPNRYLPLSLMCEGDLDFDELPLGSLNDQGLMRKPYYLVRGEGGHLYSTYGVGPGLAATPLFMVARWVDPVFPWSRILFLGKLSATLMVALSAAFLVKALETRVDPDRALLLGLVYGVGTSAWAMGSQALWQHSPALALLALALAAMTRAERSGALPLAALCLGLAVVCRPTNALIALAFTAWVALNHPRRLPAFLIAAAIPAAGLAAYSLHAFGDITGSGQLQARHWESYGLDGAWRTRPMDAAEGLLGVLISPSRGLFTYSPVLLFGAVGLLLTLRRGGDPLGRWCLAAVAGVILVHGLWFNWWGGWTYGYRLVLDALPFLVFGIGLIWASVAASRALTGAFVVALFLSIGVQALGAFSYDPRSWNAEPDVDRHPERLWSVRDSQLAYYLRNPGPSGINQRSWDSPRYTLHTCPVRILREE